LASASPNGYWTVLKGVYSAENMTPLTLTVKAGIAGMERVGTMRAAHSVALSASLH